MYTAILHIRFARTHTSLRIPDVFWYYTHVGCDILHFNPMIQGLKP